MERNERLIELTLKAKELRENENVLIQIYNNASGYLWSLSKVDSGTDLGWSDFNGDCELSGTFTTYENALEDAVTLIQKCSLQKFKSELKTNFHWGLYATHLNINYRNGK